MNRKERRVAAKTGRLPAGHPAAPTLEGPGAGALRATAIRYYQAGRYREASEVCRRVLASDPGDIACLDLTGLLALHAGRNQAAADVLGRAIGLDDKIADLHSHLAEALQRLGRLEEAVAHYQRAVSLDPGYVEALYNGANVLLRLSRYEEALRYYDRVLAVQPKFAEAIHNHGNALLGLKRYGDALAAYDRALAIKPDFVYALRNRANLMLELKRYDEALESYERALAIKPDFAAVLNDRGNALSDLGRYADAAKDFQRLLAVEPNYDYAKGALLITNLYCCDWQDYDPDVTSIEKEISAGRRSSVPYLSLFISNNPKIQLKCAKIYSEDKYHVSKESLWAGRRYSHKKIRIAYLSSDFYKHAIAYLMAGLFEAHDKSRFEVTAISFGLGIEDEMTERLRPSFEHFIDVKNSSDHDAAIRIRDLEIDIAVDVNGYAKPCRPGILSFRPAPIQVNFLGYPGTLGLGHIDYILADNYVIPADQRVFYQENIAYLPDTYQPNDARRHISEHTPTRAEAGLPETGFIFCCFNQHYKIAPPIFDIWMRLLDRVEGSVLWLLEGDVTAIQNLRWEAERRGVAAGRLIFAPRVKPEDHLARHRLADLLLDTLPYNAHTTASDALWAGLPMVTCIGSSFAGRVASSLLNAVGLPELIAKDLEEYQELALKLARDRRALAAIRSKLGRNRRTFPLFDTDRFRRHIESAYRMMWERHQRGEAPESFVVPPD
jgi:protein O-GlcNAc transferase